jgi:hypothetical protein
MLLQFDRSSSCPAPGSARSKEFLQPVAVPSSVEAESRSVPALNETLNRSARASAGRTGLTSIQTSEVAPPFNPARARAPSVSTNCSVAASYLSRCVVPSNNRSSRGIVTHRRNRREREPFPQEAPDVLFGSARPLHHSIRVARVRRLTIEMCHVPARPAPISRKSALHI